MDNPTQQTESSLTLEAYLRGNDQELETRNYSPLTEQPARLYLKPKGSSEPWAVFQIKAGSATFLESVDSLPEQE